MKEPFIPTDIVEEWLKSFPKLLWQLQDNSPPTSKVILSKGSTVVHFHKVVAEDIAQYWQFQVSS